MRLSQPGVSRLSRVATVAGPAAAVVLSILSLLAPPVAYAHRDPTVSVVLTGVTPKLPEAVVLELIDSEMTYAALRNDAAEPVFALDPEGQPFLRVSADGVYADLDSPYLRAVPRRGSQDTAVELDCCPEGSWAQLSTKSAWIWADPRLDPPLRRPTSDDDRGLGQLSSDEPLASWQLGLLHDGTTYTARGVLERRQVGAVVTTIEYAPPDVSASVIESRSPQIRIEVSKGTSVEVLDEDGNSFIRISPRGAFGRLSSTAYQAHLRAVGLPAPDGGGWQPVAGSAPTKAAWADPRLEFQADIPDDPAKREASAPSEWRIPVIINGERSEIRGLSRWKLADPPTPTAVDDSAGFWAAGDLASYLVAGGLTIAVLGAYALARIRKKESP